MSVYCPDCGHLLQNSLRGDAGAPACARCLRPLGDPNRTDAPTAFDRGLALLFTGALPMAAAWVLAGLLLIALAACLAFPASVQHWLGALGLPASAGGSGSEVPLRLVEILSIGIGLCALFLLFRLPARLRSHGRL